MAVRQLKFSNTTPQKLHAAAKFTGVYLGKAMIIGNKIAVETTYKTEQQLIELMELLPTVTGNEYDLPVDKKEVPIKK